MNELDAEDDDKEGDKIVFNVRKRAHSGAQFNKSVHLKSIVHDESPDPVIDLPKMKGSKVVMPEYVIGQKKDRKKATNRNSSDGTRKRPSEELKLDHLFEDEEDEE